MPAYNLIICCLTALIHQYIALARMVSIALSHMSPMCHSRNKRHEHQSISFACQNKIQTILFEAEKHWRVHDSLYYIWYTLTKSLWFAIFYGLCDTALVIATLIRQLNESNQRFNASCIRQRNYRINIHIGIIKSTWFKFRLKFLHPWKSFLFGLVNIVIANKQWYY